MTAHSLSALNTAPAADFVTALAGIYEHSPWIAEAVVTKRPFASLVALHDAMIAVVRAASAEKQLALVKAHPDLAGKAARAGELTTASTNEQMSAGLDRLSEADYARFHQLNDGYKARFGFPFIVCVRRHTKDSILRAFEQRLAHSADQELSTALTEIFRIAALRLDQAVVADDKLKIAGRLSTHVLDTHAGHPAKGVAVELWELSASGDSRFVARGTTNGDGRTDAPLIGGRPVPIGIYELHFDVAAYFAGRGVVLPDPPFLGIVPIRFSVAEPEAHYHVPLLVTPWSYSTYRGS
ncbi:2-oxo-4-hydroxy-4-carboxy-5-ureidoimidazoline decarboxylase [Microbacteriaceae bacterium K1510]|nr:2-oxo-4-hydroxy-4-carboxy-5-ureidoimidazoline decarboxylase [Microbacteriaceae bacterium K1510]